MISEFKGFLLKTNALALAVGVIIGGALGTVVNSLVNDIIMPPIGMALGGVDFKDLFAVLNGATYPSLEAAKAAGAPVVAYGNFINTIIQFLIVAFVIFLMVRQINRLKTPTPSAPQDESRDCPFCISKISREATKCPNCTSALQPA